MAIGLMPIVCSACSLFSQSSSSYINYYSRMSGEAFTVVSNYEVGYMPMETRFGTAEEVVAIDSGMNEGFKADYPDQNFTFTLTLNVICGGKTTYTASQSKEHYEEICYTVGAPDYIDTPDGYGQWHFADSRTFIIPASAFTESGEIVTSALLKDANGKTALHGEAIQRIGFTINADKTGTMDYCTPFYFGNVIE